LVSIKSAYAISFYSLIVTVDVSATVFEILTFKATKWLDFPTPLLFDAPNWGNPLEFLDVTYPAKAGGMGLSYCENFMILT